MNECLKNVSHTKGGQFLLLGALNVQNLHCKYFASVATWGYVASTCPPHNIVYSESLMAPMMHPRHQPLNGKGHIFRCGGVWHQHAGDWWFNFIGN